jgi:glucose/mannose-6-phosphate isomerase
METLSFDPGNMYRAIYDFPHHLKTAMTIGQECTLRPQGEIRNIVVAGMGGSAIGGDIVTLLTQKSRNIPMMVSRHYELPEFVDENTLVICSSYSGNTEETLAAFQSALERNARIVGISTGGTLTQLMEANHLDLVRIPGGLQPRAALGFSLVPMLFILEKLELISGDFKTDLTAAIRTLETDRETYGNQSDGNPVWELAEKIYSKIPVIYGQTKTGSVIALRWKGQLSENGKMLAFHNELPEMNHNEIVGWENNPDLLKQFFIIWIRDRKDHPRVAVRQKITSEIIGEQCAGQEVVSLDGNSDLERWLRLIHFGDWLSYWCAFLHETDPTPVEKISRLKETLAKS